MELFFNDQNPLITFIKANKSEILPKDQTFIENIQRSHEELKIILQKDYIMSNFILTP